ncbi:hypothetical protein [Streptomyces sp. NPDC015130]|uniref:hypothetical protein n=1 Tax=Streptomyces sp. NPDC015130 TaxID=3364940 RepID=UPI0036F623F8
MATRTSDLIAMLPPTATEFSTAHGDPTTWMPAVFEAYENLAAIDAAALQPAASVHLLAGGTTRGGEVLPQAGQAAA